MHDNRLDPRPAAGPLSAPRPEADDHCRNCLFIADPTQPGEGFWACQNLCVR